MFSIAVPFVYPIPSFLIIFLFFQSSILICMISYTNFAIFVPHKKESKNKPAFALPIFSVLSLCFQKFLFLSDDSQKRNYSNYQHSPKSNCKLILRRIFMPDRRCNFSHKYRRNQSSYSTNNRKYTTGSGHRIFLTDIDNR